MESILIIAYLAWGFYSGWKFLKGKNDWLDQPEFPNRIVKALLSLIVGAVIGVYYFVYWVLKLLGKLGM